MTMYRRLDHQVPAYMLDAVGDLYYYDSICYNDVRKETIGFLRTEFPDIATAKIIALSQHDAHGHLWGILLLQFPGQEDWSLVAEFGHWLSAPESHIPIKMAHFRFIWFGELSEPRPRAEDSHKPTECFWTMDGIERHDDWIENFDPWAELIRTLRYIESPERSNEAA